MKNLRFYPLAILSLCLATGLHAEDQDTGMGVEVEVSHKICKGLNGAIEAEVRTQDGIDELERLAIGAGLDYKMIKWLKADAGYVLLMRNIPEHNSSKYHWEQYWSPRHRAYLSLTGTWNPSKHWTLSLRERYQYTYEARRYAQRFYLSDGHRGSDRIEGGDNEQLLRSRLQVKWNRKKCAWSPYANVEMLNDIHDGLNIDQIRYTAGCDYKINKHNTLGISYRFKDKSDRDEAKGHLLTFHYAYEF